MSELGNAGINVLVEDNRYRIFPPDSLKRIVPCSDYGETKCNGKVKKEQFQLESGDVLEFIPVCQPGELTWTLEVRYQGVYVVAKVNQQASGRYTLPALIKEQVVLDIKNYLKWEDLPPTGQIWDFQHLRADLQALGVVYGLREEAWNEILKVNGNAEVLVAQATLPTAPQAGKIENFVGIPVQEELAEDQSVDFFASKVRVVPEGSILARKRPGKPGLPGRDVFGRVLPEPPFRDLQFKLKKNVHLSPDGLEVIASCAGLPVRLDEVTFMVENVYVQQKDVDLATGSIEFPGDVYVGGNVHDGLHIYSSGRVEILGAVSRAEIRAEKGLKTHRNVLASKVIVGEKHVIRSELLNRIRELHERLEPCLQQTESLSNSQGAQNLKPGQCLKLVLEKNFPDLPKVAAETEKFVLQVQDELVTQDLVISVRTAKHFLAGLGPLDLQALPFLRRIDQAFAQMIENISLEVPDKLECVIDYVQGSTIESGGSLKCIKGTYNSTIRANGDVLIEGVCRGGKVISGGNVKIHELGGSGVSTTTVQFNGTKRLKVGYCHQNVIIIVDKEIIQIEEAYRQLEVYRERGIVQVEKFLTIPRNI